MIDAFGYLRVSSIGQTEHDGFPRQREAIQKYANAHGIRIVQWFEESISGKTEWEDRPKWIEMIAALNGVRTIVIERLDRLARELMVQEYILADVRKKNITILSTTEDDVSTADPTRVLLRQIMGSIAQFDRTMLVAKMAAAKKRIKARGERCDGRKPYGHTMEERETIQMAQYLRGSCFWGYEKIATHFNETNRPARTGGRWHAATVRKILLANQRSVAA